MKIAKDLRHLKGLVCEILGCIYLYLKGYKILKWNYKVKGAAQVDIVVLKNDVIRLVEVKYRKKFINCVDAISYQQLNRLKKTANNIGFKHKKSTVVDGLYFSLDKPYICHKKNIF